MTPNTLEDAASATVASFDPCAKTEKPLRVAGNSVPRLVAGAIAGQIRASGCTELHAVGPEAVNQTVKSIALAKSYLLKDNIEILSDIDFIHIDIKGEARNGVRFCVRDINPDRFPKP